MRELFHNVSPQHSIVTANLTGNGTTTTGVTVDLQGYNAAEALFEVGAPGDTLSGSLKMTLKVQDSSDNVTFADVPAASLLTESGVGAGADGVVAVLDNSSTAQNGSRCYRAGYIGGKRYLQLDVVRTGNNATGTPIGACVILGAPFDAPAKNAG